MAADRTAVVATNADFRINCALNVKVPFSVRNYEAVYPYNYNQGTAAMNVYGVFKPVTNFYYGCTMQNGSTMDLRAWPADSGWPMYSRFTGGKKDIGFASGTAEAPSIVNVNLAGRTDLNAVRKSENPYVVTWSSQPANVNFVLDAQSRTKATAKAKAKSCQTKTTHQKDQQHELWQNWSDRFCHISGPSGGRPLPLVMAGGSPRTARPTIPPTNPKTKAAGRGKFFCPPVRLTGEGEIV